MAIDYGRMKALASRLTKENNRGDIRLVRYSDGTAPQNDYDPPSPQVRTEVQLYGIATGVSEAFIGSQAGGETIVASDKEVLVGPFEGEYDPGDTLLIDGKEATILSVRDVLAAGEPLAVRFIVRG